MCILCGTLFVQTQVDYEVFLPNWMYLITIKLKQSKETEFKWFHKFIQIQLQNLDQTSASKF